MAIFSPAVANPTIHHHLDSLGVPPLLTGLLASRHAACSTFQDNFSPCTPSFSTSSPTHTFALLPGSPAIDTGDNATCLSIDQRGISRPQNTTCDIGAFESRGFTLAATGGTPQTTPINTAFANPLALTISSTFGEPVDGGQVIFSAPSSGASLTFTETTTTVSGGAVSLPVTANGITGTYSVSANAGGNLGSAVGFALTNASTTYDLNVNLAGTGSGSVTSNPAGIDCGTDCSQTYNYGTVVTLTATADTGSTFMGWAGACTGAGDCVVTMDAAQNVTATFTLGTNVLTVLKDGAGSGSVTSVPAGIDCGSDCSELYDYGTVVTLTATAVTGRFVGWSGACTGAGACVVTMDAAKNVTATFTLYSVFLPVVMNNYPPQPDLIVETITITADSLAVVIRNTSDGVVSDSFWVDMYINPDTPPTGVNQTWVTNGGEGLVWGIANLSMAPGEALTLTLSSPYYAADASHFSGTIAVGSTVYAQVDSVGPSWFGNVYEADEANNINGPVTTTGPSTPANISSTMVIPAALRATRP